MRTIELDEIDSTNEYCKRVDDGEDLIVTARRQTAGKGTKGRSFSSDEGGLYISIMRHFAGFPARNAFKIMINSCVAVCRTLEKVGLKPVIRWSNDILIGGKKICGTLIENTFCGNNITRSIVGLGLNINNKLPENLHKIATTAAENGVLSTVDEVKSILIENFSREYSVDDYKAYIDWFGREVIFLTPCGEMRATAIDVSDDGRLIVEKDGKKQFISSAEVSLRL